MNLKNKLFKSFLVSALCTCVMSCDGLIRKQYPGSERLASELSSIKTDDKQLIILSVDEKPVKIGFLLADAYTNHPPVIDVLPGFHILSLKYYNYSVKNLSYNFKKGHVYIVRHKTNNYNMRFYIEEIGPKSIKLDLK